MLKSDFCHSDSVILALDYTYSSPPSFLSRSPPERDFFAFVNSDLAERLSIYKLQLYVTTRAIYVLFSLVPHLLVMGLGLCC